MSIQHSRLKWWQIVHHRIEIFPASGPGLFIPSYGSKKSLSKVWNLRDRRLVLVWESVVCWARVDWHGHDQEMFLFHPSLTMMRNCLIISIIFSKTSRLLTTSRDSVSTLTSTPVGWNVSALVFQSWGWGEWGETRSFMQVGSKASLVTLSSAVDLLQKPKSVQREILCDRAGMTLVCHLVISTAKIIALWKKQSLSHPCTCLSYCDCLKH
jgi:hypothetical protein